MRVMRRDGYSPPIFRPSRDHTKDGQLVRGMAPLQAADFAAYELRKITGMIQPNRGHSKSIVSLSEL